MRAIVSGAGGFIGSHLVDRLVADGHFVVGVDEKLGTDWLRGRNSATFELSLLDVSGPCAELKAWLNEWSDERFDVCFHLAAESRIQPSFNRPLEYVQDNIVGTARMLELCRKYKIPQLVYAGSSTADDDVAKNVYATTKIAGEQLCRAWNVGFGLKTAIARFYNVYGPRQIEDGQYATVIGIFERQWRNGEKLTVTGDGSQRRDFTHVADIVDGLISIARKQAIINSQDYTPTYSLGSGINWSILQVAKMFVDDDRIAFIPRPRGEAAVTLANINHTSRALNWRASRSLLDYIHDVKRNTANVTG
jgi:UDP-glucose 4-epimerase